MLMSNVLAAGVAFSISTALFARVAVKTAMPGLWGTLGIAYEARRKLITYLIK